MGWTTVMMTHKLQVMQICDQIVVVDGGEVKEQGTFEELLAKKDVLRRWLVLASGSASKRVVCIGLHVALLGVFFFFFFFSSLFSLYLVHRHRHCFHTPHPNLCIPIRRSPTITIDVTSIII